ncbi:MAG: malonate--CoA ligase [Pseudomonadota bacterium]
MTEHDENFFSALAAAAAAKPERDCLRLPDGSTWSYAAMMTWTERMGGALRHLGVSAGDRVVAQVEKSPHAVALYLGCLRIGAAYVPLNTAYTAEEVRYFLGDAEPALYVCDPDRAGSDTGAAASGVAVATLGEEGTGSLLSLAGQVTPFTGIEPRERDALAAIVYTSGTTGRSKGAMLSHGNLDSGARVLLDAWGWRDDDVLLHALPIFHVHGLFVALHCALLSATPMTFLPRFDVGAVAAALPSSTVMMGVPTFYTRLLERDDVNRETCAGMRLFVSGSAPLTEQTFAAWEARTGHRILERYGMSETMMNTSNPLAGERVPGTVGFPLPGVELRIASTADGTVLGPDEVGVIEVRGPNVFSGYWRMPERTAQEFRSDGYFITGDLGVMDAAGRVSIVGRDKDLIISGGYNVYPKEIERLLDELPGVRESAVIGVPHPDFGEGVVAVLVTDGRALGEDQVREALADRLARFKQPKAVVHVPQLPRNAMGKVQKNVLREQYANMFE